ncbi:hypothetical protein BDA99DRAFT_438457 [Phascolomyces articulosus]|uniref:Uncharacterized protein n=1 Tax=Phascolomyces articulosus TaxID=60185 RepID=A0AAD5PFR0_9FUNG|nr:hypothetical protein BDA99DRAFT_438457 [Phascolomyces articulosus]
MLLPNFSAAQQSPGPVDGTYVKDISECPQLAPRSSPPAGPHDLRPDDIKVVAALGDSIMAGFALEGINDGENGTSLLNASSITEFRGQSWGIGGDEGAVTIGNFVKHFNASSEGQSHGSHLATICYAKLCLDMFRHADLDVLNGALSGGIAMNLKDELDYLIPRMKELPNVNFETDWKMITIQIGSNDQCASCNNPFSDEVTTEKFGGYMAEAIERIKNEVPRVLVNVVGSFNVSVVYNLTKGQEYCRPIFDQPNFLLNRAECPCFLDGKEETRHSMDLLSASYNDEIMKIYNKYKGQESETFAIRYTPPLIDIGSFPLHVMSNMDCFHPGKLAHQWVAKIYCPSENDRIITH